ncbi:Folylpolyglutamate synthase [Lachnellula hyalina]|uniref:Folylpolyglutamate synthase n=1 Tax=Lachnellula hyalina TaxID=1316788 RepID=A0A8H8R6B3_9HELO|nr:Folylpolyglutamate synthase [Lachnellula hyalina]TVY28801.1 Folylpolyglutamate synthase [Lachnellula hyalina]
MKISIPPPPVRRTYEDALAALQTLQLNSAIRTAIADAPQDTDPNRRAIPEMLEWARKAGYEAAELGNQGQRYIHVAGTNGKGSVCVMVENILLQYRRAEVEGLKEARVGKIGLYTSPHLVTVRERIRIDGVSISESLFTHYFYELWDRFETAASNGKNHDTGETQPGYFRYLTLLAIHVFRQEGVKTAIMECGIGGEYDSTNILPANAVAVSAITRLGIDHTSMLGGTIEEIAWHKGGIMKEGVPVFTMDQPSEALGVLEERAAETGMELNVVHRLPVLETADFFLGLLGDFQSDNASLATAVAASYLRGIGDTEGIPLHQELGNLVTVLPQQFEHGLETVTWPGRCEIRKDGNIEWFLDGAHTIESMEAVGRWFRTKMDEAHLEEQPPTATMLIFNQDERDGQALLQKLLLTMVSFEPPASDIREAQNIRPIKPIRYLQLFTYAAFCTNEPFTATNEGKNVNLKLQEGMAMLYQGLDGNALHMVYGSVEEAVRLAMRVSEGDERVLVLVTGSLHLVGGLLQVLERGKEFLVEEPCDDEQDLD